ncbi:SpoIIIAH-like family protein [Mahella sp.]|uniref:SpoIIIAH-like family protein n=1 Tax=Mahella sp. TaxID=2798721 RepID=UPI0025BF4A6F|nr:SpoIIIAH-like family protein [Mahella sp.]MBZ4666428.1 hypothetical protein [Mahella sp.]
MVILRRRTIVIVSLVALLFLTGYLNYYYGQQLDNRDVVQTNADDKASDVEPVDADEDIQPPSTPPASNDIEVKDVPTSASSLEQQAMTSSTSAATFFIEYRLEREKVRSQEIDTLKEILTNADMDEESKAEAEQTLSELIKTNETEMAIENLIKAKGFKDALAFVHEDSTNIIVSTPDKLTPADVAKIQDVVMQRTNQPAEKIKIIERK